MSQSIHGSGCNNWPRVSLCSLLQPSYSRTAASPSRSSLRGEKLPGMSSSPKRGPRSSGGVPSKWEAGTAARQYPSAKSSKEASSPHIIRYTKDRQMEGYFLQELMPALDWVKTPPKTQCSSTGGIMATCYRDTLAGTPSSSPLPRRCSGQYPPGNGKSRRAAPSRAWGPPGK